jgi:hypothetical protein
MKREGSRFTREQLNQVISNWESVASWYGGTFELLRYTIDDRGPVYQLINPVNIDYIQHVLYKIEVAIPHLNRSIRITSSEYKPPIFKYDFPSVDFSFSITNEDFLDKISKKLLGLKELEIGQSDFDKRYLLSGNNPDKLKYFLDTDIRCWLEKISIGYFDLNTEKSKQCLSLFLSFDEFNTDKIKEQIEKFKYSINRILS